MKTRLFLAIIFAVFSIAVGALLAGPGGSHPNFKNNGKDSPRFYGSPRPLHPSHP